MFEPEPRAQPPPASGTTGLWRWRRNPLRRRCDLLQAWTGLLLTVVVAAATPTAMVVVHGSVQTSLRESAAAEARTRERVTAVLVRDTPRHPEPGSDEARHSRYPAEVRFPGPDGTPRTGTTEVVPGLPAGSTVRVWRDSGGRLTEAPMRESEIRSRAYGWAGSAGAAIALTGVTLYAVIGRILDRKRAAAWERAWADTSPRWTASA